MINKYMDDKDKKKKVKKVRPPDDIASGHAMDHIIIRMSDGETKKEILNKRGWDVIRIN